MLDDVVCKVKQGQQNGDHLNRVSLKQYTQSPHFVSCSSYRLTLFLIGLETSSMEKSVHLR